MHLNQAPCVPIALHWHSRFIINSAIFSSPYVENRYARRYLKQAWWKSVPIAKNPSSVRGFSQAAHSFPDPL